MSEIYWERKNDQISNQNDVKPIMSASNIWKLLYYHDFKKIFDDLFLGLLKIRMDRSSQ